MTTGLRFHGTLTATTVATVSATAPTGVSARPLALGGIRTTVKRQNSLKSVAIYNHGTGVIYATIDGTAPTVQGADTFVVPANGEPRIFSFPQGVSSKPVKLISSGTPSYSVEYDF
jgi:hypothetical protein